jgi:major membrane immunogen (membrane-anchored lipoprotein)
MKKRAYLFLILLPVVLIFSGCGKKADSNKVSPDAQNNAATENKESENTKMSASVKELMKGGKSLECTFSFTDQQSGVTQSGKFYIDGSKARFRSEMAVTTNKTGEKNEAYMITDGDYGYSWSNISPKTGIKFNLNEPASLNNPNKNGQNTEDLDQKIDFDCRKWSVDKSKFDLPTGVEFTDFEQMMKSLSVPTGAANINVCAICSQIPDAAAKAECQKTNCK